MKNILILCSILFSLGQAQAQHLRDDFNRAATTDIAGSNKWRRVLNLNDTSATIQLNADSTVSPRNLLGPFNRGAAYWDSALSGSFQVGMILRHKNGNDGIPSFHLHVMTDSSWTTGNGYTLRYQTNPTSDRMDLQRISATGTDTPNVTLLANLDREFSNGDTLIFKIYANGRKTAVVYGVGGQKDSISVIDTVYRPTTWIPWIQGRVFNDPVKMDNFTIGPIPYPITASAGPGGSISPPGVTLVAPGDSLTYSITPDPGFAILSLTIDTTTIGPSSSYTFSGVNAAHTIAAAFDTADYTITATASPNGTITPSGSVPVAGLTDRSFSIVPDAGYHIDSVVVDGVNQGALASYTFTSVTANHTIAASFSINVYTITATSSAGGTITPSGSVSVNHGANQSFTIAPNTGFHIDSVVVDGVNQGAVASFPFTNVTANHSIAAYFSINVYTITATASAGGTISPSGSVSVNHGANQSFTIAPNTGFHIDSVVVDGSNQGAITSHTFTNVTAGHTIAAYFSINVYTIAATASAGGTISPSGSVSVNHGGSQSFTIAPNTGFHIDSVVVDGANQGALASVPFTNVIGNHTIAAYFSINVYTITATASAGGTITPSGSVSVNHGANQSFTIAPNTGFHIDSVVVDGVNQGAITSFPFTNVTANHVIAAYFSINVYTITATASAGGTITPSGSVSVNHGANQSFTIAPNTGFHIDSVVVDGSNQGAITSHTFTNVTAGHTIAAYFSINVYTITATASAGGTISPSGAVSVNHSANQSFAITPNTGFHIDSVVVDGANQGAIASQTFTNVTAGHTIAAYFSINVYTVTATASAGGTITPSGSVSVNHGANQSFTIAPNTGFHIDSVVVDGVNQGAVTSLPFTNVTANHTIAAHFSINVYTITATASAGGTITPSGSVNVNHGGSQLFTMTPNAGFHVDSVVVNGVNQGAAASFNYTSVTANGTIAAYFSINVYTITAAASAGGTITPSGSISVNHGANQSFTISPNTGRHIDSVVVDGVNQGAVASFPFTNVTTNHTISAYFSINVYTVTATASAGGTITPSGSVSVNHGANQSFTIAPNTGFHIDSVVVDGTNQGAITSFPFTNVTANHAIAAYFSINVYTIAATASAGGTITPSGSVSVNHGANQSFTIAPNTGRHIDSVVVDGVNQGAVASFPFTNVTTNHSITAYFSINVYTIIATASAGGTISPSGSVSVNHGGSQLFTMTPNTGSHVDSVVVNGVNQGAVSSFNYTNATSNGTIAAYFSINVYTLTATASAGGTISPSGSVGVNHGANQSFTIASNIGFHIDSVVVDGVNQGAVTSFPFTNVTANHSIAAHFSINVYTITATASAGGTITPSGAVSVNHGANQSFTISPNTGRHIDSVVVDGVNQGAVASFPFTNVTANHTIASYFSINVYTITATASAGGTISPSGSVSVGHGGSQLFTMTPNAGYHVDSVVVNGVNQGAAASFNYTNVTANGTIGAFFSINVYTITATASAGGTITPSGSVGVNHGANQSFTIAPNTGFHIDSVVVDGSNQGAITSHSFTNVTAGHAIAAYFSINVYTITAGASSGGSIFPFGAVSANYGDDPSFTITPNTGSHVDSVVVDGVNQGALTVYTFTDVAADHGIQAYFSINAYVITAAASAGGSISPSGLVGASYGQNRAFTITPDGGHHIDSVVADGVNLGVVTSHTFTNITADHAIAAYFSINAYTITATASAGGTITPSGSVSVNHGGSQSFTIAPNTGRHTDSVVVDGVNQGSIASFPFTNVTANHTIAAYFSINVYAITASASAGGTITPSGSINVNHGGSQSFTISPNAGFHIDSVVVDGLNQGAVASFPFTNVSADHAIAAYFSINVYTITATASAGGTMSPSGSLSVNHGASQSFTIAPGTGYHIDSVVVDGLDQGALTNHAFNNVTANHAIAAYFSIDTYAITASASAGGTITPSGSVSVNHGADQSFTIEPNTGFHVDSVVADGVNLGAVTNHAFNNVTANHAIAAYFSIDTYAITASASAGGTITPAGTVSVDFGQDRAFTMTPDSGYHVDSVVIDGVNQGALASYQFDSVTAGHSIGAYFSINAYTISASASAGGTISPSGAVGVSHGGGQSFTIAPGTGYHIDSVVVDGLNQGALTAYAFSNVTSNRTIAAHFSINVYAVAASASAGGSISPSGSVSVDHGAGQSFTMTPDTGYHVDSVVVNGVNQGAVVNYDYSNATANGTISAYFSINAYAIAASASAGGTISPSGTVSVNHGEDQSFTVAPEAGYHLDSVVVDGVNQGAVAAYTFTGITGAHTIGAWFTINSYTIAASASAGGSISPAGAVGVTHGATASFTITPDTGRHVDSVVVDGVNLGAITAHDFTGVESNHSIAAYFSINMYAIAASASAGGSISPSGPVAVAHGDDRAFSIVPATGYHIDSVVVDGVDQGPVPAYSFTDITQNHAIVAHFSIDVLTIAASAGPGGSITPSGSVGAAYGSSPSFSIVPDAGRHVDSVVVDGVNVGAVTAWQFDTVTSAHAIAAHFSINIYTVTALQSPNGSITPAGGTSVSWGDSLTYAIVPDTGYYVAYLLVDSVEMAGAESFAFQGVTTDHSISATFGIRTFPITSSASSGGSVSPAGIMFTAWGDSVAITVTPDVGHHVDSVLVDGVNLGPLSAHAFLNVTAAHTLSAYFSIDLFAVAASASAGGSISPSGSVAVAYGSSQTFAIIPDTGYNIGSVIVDGANVGAVASYTFGFVTATHSIAAHFSLKTFQMVSSVPDGGGSISPAGAVTVTWGDSLAYTVIPDTGYHVDSVVVDGVNLGIVTSYVFHDLRAGHLIEAYFSQTAFVITAGASGTGTISPSGAVGVAFGGSPLFTMNPTAGCHLDSVLVDGVNIGAVSSYQFTDVQANHAIAAWFSINYYALTASAGAGGTISPSGTQTLVHGSSQTYTITPSTGYRIANVSVDGEPLGPRATYTFNNLSAPHTIEAEFTRMTFSVIATAGANGSVSPAGSSAVAWGDSIAYAIVPTPGFYIAGVIVDGVPIGPVAAYTFTNVTASHAISATFTSNAAPSAFGLVAPADGISVPPAALAALRFKWRRSFDANAGDILKYVLTLSGPGVNFSSFELTDTAVTLDLRGLAIVNFQTYRWTVRVNDGTVIVASPDTFDIRIDPTTAVGDGRDAAPREFALGQNYPNPFNPSTSVPFELPERAAVTIRIYNLVGAEVASLAEDESMPAGSYVREAGFAGLPSGVYFCRMSAKGESGETFAKVVRMVLMR